MNLRTALSIYTLDGPTNDTRSTSIKANASAIVHTYLTQEEMAKVSKAWAQSKVSKVPFLELMTEIRQRLEVEGKL